MNQTFYLQGRKDTNGRKAVSLNMTMTAIMANIGEEGLGLFQVVESLELNFVVCLEFCYGNKAGEKQPERRGSIWS